MRHRTVLSFAWLFIECCLSLSARAQERSTSTALSANADLRLVAVDGEPSWLDDGYGKLRFGSAGDARVEPYVAEANIVWRPRLSWALTGTVVAVAQHRQQHAVDLSEAFLTLKPLMRGDAKVSGRAGLMWPPVSLEHGGGDWHVLDTITPSAINSWIGEEVKVGAVEATVNTPVAGTRFSLTAALFGFNDTAGTLLAFRGWALHDEKATVFGLQPLPPIDGFMLGVQATRTRPVAEIDHRLGYYARLGWAPLQGVELNAFRYENRGDPEAVTSRLQWGWRTTFNNFGAQVMLGPVTLKSQALIGRTRMGYPMPDRLWVDTRFRSAFLLATARLPRGSVSLRGEAFGTRSRGSVLDHDYDDNSSWAVTGALRREFGAHLTTLAEIVYVDSNKDERTEAGLTPEQHQTQAQLALRLHL